MSDNLNLNLKNLDRATLSDKYLEYRVNRIKPKSFLVGFCGCFLFYYINKNIANAFCNLKRTKFLTFALLNVIEFNLFYHINEWMYLDKYNEKLIYKYSYILEKNTNS